MARPPLPLQELLRDCRGATAVEYGLILAFLALIVVLGLTLVGVSLSSEFSSIASFFAAH